MSHSVSHPGCPLWGSLGLPTLGYPARYLATGLPTWPRHSPQPASHPGLVWSSPSCPPEHLAPLDSLNFHLIHAPSISAKKAATLWPLFLCDFMPPLVLPAASSDPVANLIKSSPNLPCFLFKISEAPPDTTLQGWAPASPSPRAPVMFQAVPSASALSCPLCHPGGIRWLRVVPRMPCPS